MDKVNSSIIIKPAASICIYFLKPLTSKYVGTLKDLLSALHPEVDHSKD